MHGLFDMVEKEVINMDHFITDQNERARQMKDEMNHLIEYYTVLKKAGQLIFGEDQLEIAKKLKLDVQKRDAPEERLLRDQRHNSNSESDNSDDYLFGGEGGQNRARYESSQSMREAGVSIGYIAGTILQTEQRAFEKLIFRVSRGKVLTRFHDQSF